MLYVHDHQNCCAVMFGVVTAAYMKKAIFWDVAQQLGE